MPITSALGNLGYGRVGYTTLPTGLGWISARTNLPRPDSTGIPAVIDGPFMDVDVTNNITYHATENQLSKLDSSGTSTLYKTVGSNTNDISFDGSGNMYIVGHKTVSSYEDMYIAKINSSGTVQWGYTYGDGGYSDDNGLLTICDSSNNVFMLGQVGRNSGFAITNIIKMNSSATILWQKAYNTSITSVDEYPEDVVMDSSGDLYVYIQLTYNAHLMKVEGSTGNLLWNKNLGSFVGLYSSGSLAISGSNVVFSTVNFIATFNGSTGATVTQKTLTYGLSNIGSDSSGNIYGTSLQYGSGTQYSIYLTGLDSSLNVLWTNNLVLTNQGSSTPLLAEPSSVYGLSNNLRINVIGRFMSSTSSMYVLNLPKSGSVAGSGRYRIGTQLWTVTTATNTASTISNTYPSGTITVTTPTRTLTSSTTTSSSSTAWTNIVI